MRPRADGQRQGQIQGTGGHIRAFADDELGSVGGPAIRKGSGRGRERVWQGRRIDDRDEIRFRPDQGGWWRPRAGELGQIRRSLAWFRTLQEGYMEE